MIKNDTAVITVIETGHCLKAALGRWRSPIGALLGPMVDAWITLPDDVYCFGLRCGEYDVYPIAMFDKDHQERLQRSYNYAIKRSE